MPQYERNNLGIRFDNDAPSFDLQQKEKASLIRFLMEHSGGLIKTRQSAARVLILLVIIMGALTFFLLQNELGGAIPIDNTILPPSQRT